MTSAKTEGLDTFDIHGTEVQAFVGGQGPNVVYLHSALWVGDDSTFVRELAKQARVIAPLHPGIGAGKDANKTGSVDDLAYLYLDLIEHLKLRDVTLVGASFGGWIAAEMAVRNCNALSKLVLVDALGIKVGARDHRDIVDFFGTPDKDLRAMSFAEPANAGGDLRSLGDDDLRTRLRARETLARYGWQPYMHNPRLRLRLHRINVPTLVLWGDRDGIARPDYGRAYADLIPGAQFELVNNAGHLAHIEHAEQLASRIHTFAHNR